MERGTFPDEAVRGFLSGLVAVKLDVDSGEGRTLRARFAGSGGVPAFALLDPSGAVVLRAVGGREPGPFVEMLEGALRARRKETEEERARRAVEEHFHAGRFGDAIAAAEAYLARHAEHAGDVGMLRGRARFARDRTLEPELERRIREGIAVWDTPYPGDTLGARVRSFFGRPVPEEECDRWVAAQNAALDDLGRVGEPAVELLLRSVFGGPRRRADRCGAALARVASPRARPILLAWARDRTLPAFTREAAVSALAGYADAALAETFLASVADGRESVRVRREAAYALKTTLMSAGGASNERLAPSLLAAIAVERDLDVLSELMQTLYSLPVRYDLDRLLPLLDDTRDTGFDTRICDYAASNLLERLGKRLEGCEAWTPEVMAFLRERYEREKPHLAWDETRRIWARAR